MGGESESSPTLYELGFSAIDSDAIAEALSRLKLQETKEIGTVEIGVGDMSEIKEGSNGEWEEGRSGDAEKKEIEEREQGIESEIEKKRESEENSDYDSKKKDTERREEGIDGDSENVENQECVDSSNSEEKNGEEEDQDRLADGEKQIGGREQRIDCGSENGEIEEKEEVRNGDNEKKELSENDEERDGHNEDKGEEREDESDCKSEKKEGEIVLKERVKFTICYPQRPNTQDCPSFLQTGSCSYGLACWYNHPPRKSSEVSANTDCKEREREGNQEKNEVIDRSKAKYALPYPQREGKVDCMFYLKTGRCSYGSNCCFNHPPGNLNQVYVLFSSWRLYRLARRFASECNLH